MPENPESLRALKTRLSRELLTLHGVSGVGTPGGKLTVYLEEDSPRIRQTVESIVRQIDQTIHVLYLVTGAFRGH